MSNLIRGANTIITVDVTTTGSIMAPGDQLGETSPDKFIRIPNIGLSSSSYVFLDEIRIIDTTNTPNAAALDFFFFKDVVTATGDNAVFSVSDADLTSKWQWKISTGGSTYTTVTNNGVGIIDCGKKLLRTNKDGDLILVIRLASGTPTFANGSLKLLFAVLQD